MSAPQILPEGTATDAADFSPCEQAAPSQGRLATETGLSAKAVGQAVRRLVAEHWLAQVSNKRPGRGAHGEGYRYALTVPQKVAAARRYQERHSQFPGSSQTSKPAAGGVKTAASALKCPQKVVTRDSVIGVRTEATAAAVG